MIFHAVFYYCSHLNLQSLTNCKCKVFFGSVSEMKGNEARVVFFLHPRPKSSEGKVTEENPQNWVRTVTCNLLLFFGLLGLPVIVALVWVLTNIKIKDSLFSSIGLIACSSLLFLLLAYLLEKRMALKGRFIGAWREWRSKPPKERRPLLYTHPYYLALTRSCCEVTNS